jgi:NAD(P)-dependent dehydrogenase (short-subunit alcohol dehydrogenase family)
MGKLDNKIAVITGGSSGIGLATAQAFIKEGAYVYITGRRQDELDKARALLGSQAATVRGDIADLDDLDRLYAKVRSEKGRVDVIVANAAYVELKPLAAATPEHFDKTFNTNARGTYFTVAKALPLLADGASVVLVSSGMNVKGYPAYGTYAATKAAIRSFSRTWAHELKDRGIRVNTLSPGVIDTPIIDAQFTDKAQADGAREMFKNMTPLGRLGKPEEMAAAILFLASSDSSFSTGIDLVADGGITSL